MEEHPILKALVNNLGELYDLGVKEYGYKESSEGYVSKCHLCADIRKYIVHKTMNSRNLVREHSIKVYVKKGSS